MEQIGRYRIHGVIGSGGFGTVYLGVDPATGESVAVKVLDWPGDGWRRQMFRDEVAALLSVVHPNVVRVRDVIDTPDMAALVTDFVEGASLREILRRSGPLDGPQSLSVLWGALSGLSAVHAAGLVHADLKPENILLDTTGTSRLIDFGLAGPPRLLGGPDTWIGTPAYLAPEVVVGAHIDQRSDIYAAAAMLFELLCGRPPYVGPNPVMTALLHLQSDIPSIRRLEPTVSEALADLCTRDLAKDPGERHDLAVAFLQDLERAASQTYGGRWAAAGAGLGTLVGTTLAGLPGGAAGIGLLGAAPVAAAGAAALGAGGAAVGAIGTAGIAGGTSVVAGVGAAGATGAAGGGTAGTGALAAIGGAKGAVAAASVFAVVAAGVGAAVLINNDAAATRPPAATGPAILLAQWGGDLHLVRADGSDTALPIDKFSDGFTVSADGQWLAGVSRGDLDEPKDDQLLVVSTADPAQQNTVSCEDCAEPRFDSAGRLYVDDGTAFRSFTVAATAVTAAEPRAYPADLTAVLDECGARSFALTSIQTGWLYGTVDCPSEVAHVLTNPETGEVRTLTLPAVQGELDEVAVSPDGRYVAGRIAFDGLPGSGVTVLDLGASLTSGTTQAVALAGPSGAAAADQSTGVWFDGAGLATTWGLADTPSDNPAPSGIRTAPLAGLGIGPVGPDGSPGSAQNPATVAWTSATESTTTWTGTLPDGTTASVVDDALWIGDPDNGGVRVAEDVGRPLILAAVETPAPAPSPVADLWNLGQECATIDIQPILKTGLDPSVLTSYGTTVGTSTWSATRTLEQGCGWGTPVSTHEVVITAGGTDERTADCAATDAPRWCEFGDNDTWSEPSNSEWTALLGYDEFINPGNSEPSGSYVLVTPQGRLECRGPITFNDLTLLEICDHVREQL